MLQLRAAFAAAFSCAPEAIRLNDPFRGGHITRAHGGGSLPWVQVEMNRSLDLAEPWFDRRTRTLDPARSEDLRTRFLAAVMLRIHCLQLWFNLSDPGMEQELYDSRSMLEFAGLSLSEPIPDETTILHFRHLLERQQLGTELFATINAHLAACDLQVREGTIVDSTIISAPMKLHSGTDARTGAGPQREHDGGERLRRDRGASPVARR